MKEIVIGFEMCYENVDHTKTILVEDDITPEDMMEMANDMLINYSNLIYYETGRTEKDIEEEEEEEE